MTLDPETIANILKKSRRESPHVFTVRYKLPKGLGHADISFTLAEKFPNEKAEEIAQLMLTTPQTWEHVSTRSYRL